MKGKAVRSRARRCQRLFGLAGIALALSGATVTAGAQNIISVPFTNGFIGTQGTSSNKSVSILTFTTLEIARILFIQNSPSGVFVSQGNDVIGTVRIVRTNGATVDIPAVANWRVTTGGAVDLIGFLPQPTSPVRLAYGVSGQFIDITDGVSNLGGYLVGYSGSFPTDGGTVNGNAAPVVGDLNAYLNGSRPAGPVTVSTLSTASTTPTISGTATLGTGEWT